jgi:hypothetical protein
MEYPDWITQKTGDAIRYLIFDGRKLTGYADAGADAFFIREFTVSEGCAPQDSQCCTLSIFISTAGGFVLGL